METTHAVTLSDTRRIASAVVLENGGTAHGSRCRDLVAQLSKVLQSVRVAPAAAFTGKITPGRAGALFTASVAGLDDTARRCALFVGMANGSISVTAAAELMFDDDLQLTAEETAELFDLWKLEVRQQPAPTETVRKWARAHALAALARYAAEYAAAGLLELRSDCLRMLTDVRAYVAPAAIVSAALMLLAVVLRQLAALQFPDTGLPLDIAPVVSLLIVAAILAPRAPQFRPSMA